jgi:adhesin/invasin
MTVSASPKAIPSNGVSKTEISATLFSNSGDYVPDGTMVNFSTTAGTLSSKTAYTVNGIATVSLTSDTTPSDVTVTVTSGLRSDTVDVKFQETVSYLSLAATPNSIAADGTSTCEIKATLRDNTGELVPDGTLASFTTTGGTLETNVAKTVAGIARTTLTSSKTAGPATVTVTVGSLQEKTTVTFEEVGSSVNQVAEIDLSVSDSVIEADGKTKSYITATLYRYNKGVKEIVDVPTTVVFETDIGDISKFVQSDAAGKAVAQFTSGVVGTASISAKVGTVTNYTNIIMVPGAPQSIQLTFNPTTVGVKKSGRNESLKISATVVDSKGNDVADGKMIRFELIGAFDDSVSITPNDGTNHFRSVPVPTVNGIASVSFHSGTRAGTMRVKATVVDSTGAVAMPLISSEATQFQVLSGPAFLDTSNLNDPFRNSRMTLAGGPLNIYAGELNTEASKSTITVLVGDRYQNPVPEGTAVYFTTTGGIITSKTGFTNADGLASVTLYAGNPFPKWADSSVIANPNKALGGPATFTMPGYDFDGNGTKNDGVATVTAYTEGVDQNGRQVTVWNYVPIVFSKEVAVFTATSESTTLLNGRSTVIHVTIQDSNGNPMVGGSTLEFSSPLGALSTSKITTNALGGTKYTVTLTNNIDPINGTPGNTVVTVRFKGANGETTCSTVPIYMDTRTQ